MTDARRVLITTSWDDGHPLDLRVGEALARHHLRGTFYVPLHPAGKPVLGRTEMMELLAMGMEIGSHTMTHRILTELPVDEIDRELRDSRAALEDTLGIEVRSLCYPKGRFNRRVMMRAVAAGYRLCRTSVDFRIALRFDPVRMPVSLHLYPQTAVKRYRHALRHRNWSGLWNWQARWRGETQIESLVGYMIGEVGRDGGILHLWGHSWELDWTLLNRIARAFSSIPDAMALTNAGVVGATCGTAVPVPVLEA